MTAREKERWTEMEQQILQVKHLSKSFGKQEVLKDIDFTVSKGDVISIVGKSGSGKSTLLRCINLLETPNSGEILFHGTNMAGKGANADNLPRQLPCELQRSQEIRL